MSRHLQQLAHPLLLIQLLFPPAILAAPLGSAAIHLRSVPQCGQVTLHAAYLAEEHPGAGTGFLLGLQNQTHNPITVPDPVPLSVHWYAASNNRWFWRSSSGEGGALVNAMREKGPLLAASTLPAEGLMPAWHTILPGESYSWEAFAGANPSMRYRPGCQHCTYTGETQYRAVLAYAYLPNVEASIPGTLLRCGLRSNPVVMPPLSDFEKAHNSSRR